MKPVNREEFWRERIEKAPQIRYSVYITSDEDWKRLNEAHKEIFEKEIKGTDRVLDAGCGYGRWSQLFNNYVGVDFSTDFIEKAKELYPDKEFIKADLKKLPFKDKEFDVAFCVSIKHMIVANLGESVWNEMAKELKRVAKKVLIMEYTSPEIYENL